MTTKNKPNGSYTTHGLNGGPVPPTSQRGSINPQDAPGTPARKIFTRASQHENDKAGSVDASVFSVADSASPAVSTDRKATADLAEPAAGKQSLGTEAASAPVYSERSRAGAAMSQLLQREAPRTEAPVVPMARGATNPSAKSNERRTPKSSGRKRKAANPFAEVAPGMEPLPIDGEAFVNAVHAQVDLVALEVALLRCPDEKVVQRELGSLRELRYGKRAPTDDGEGTTEIIFDAPRPKRDQ